MSGKVKSRTLRYQLLYRFLPLFTLIVIIALAISVVVMPRSTPARAAVTHPGKVGVEASNPPEFVDAIKTARLWESLSGTAVTLDQNGWPQADARTVVFDQRPCCPFFNPAQYDDPQNLHEDVSGTYHLSFKGQATLSAGEDASSFVVSNQQYNSSTNTTTADIIQAPGHQLMILQFTNSKRNASDNAGTGISNVRLIKPGYNADTTQLFTERYLNGLQAFSTLRFMGILGTNHNPGYYGDAGHHLLNWNNRHKPTDSTQEIWYDETKYPQYIDNHYGYAWEYVIAIANAANKDIWINVPPAATTDYVQNLAKLFKYGADASGNPYNSTQANPVWAPLNANLNIYIEHGNELWNFGSFLTATWNQLAAIDEVCGVPDFSACPNPIPTTSNLNADGKNDQNAWGPRRHARQVKLIGDTFRATFADNSGRIRPVLAWWLLQSAQYTDMLNWLQSTYGAPANYLSAIAAAAYNGLSENVAQNGSVDDLINNWRTNSDQDKTQYYQPVSNVAKAFGLKFFAYEGTIENRTSASDTTNIANRVLAMRDPRVKDLLIHHLNDTWFGSDGDLFIFFTSKGSNQRFGYYGATESYNDLYTSLYQGIYAVAGQHEPALGGGLTGTFYNNTSLNGDVAGIRIDDTVNFDLSNAPPQSTFAYRLNAQNFSVRWQGYIVPPQSGNYSFSIKSAGGVRLAINNQTLIDNWNIHALTTDTSNQASLTGGQPYPIKVEYTQTTGTPVVQLSWSPPGSGSQIIPAKYLYSASYDPNNGGGTPNPDPTATPTTGITPTLTATPTTTATPPTGSVTLGNASFETPDVGSNAFNAFQYNPANASWTFSPESGIAGNSGGFTYGNPNAPEGTQVAFLQNGGSISQSLTFSAGSYTITFSSAQRGWVNVGGQDIQILIDNQPVETFKPDSTSYSLHTTVSFNVTAGTHTIQFKGLNSAGGDNTAFIDDVRINTGS